VCRLLSLQACTLQHTLLPGTVEEREAQRAVVAFYCHFIALHSIPIGCWRTEITFNEFPQSSFKMKFVFICFVVWVDIISQ
jgi:hypothetical protein